MKQTNKKPSLRVYLSCAFLIFSVVLIVIMWLFQTVFLDTFYRGVKTHQVTACAKSVANNIDNTDLSSMLSEIEEQNDMSVSVYQVSNGMLSMIYAPQNLDSMRSFLNMSSVYQYYEQAVNGGGNATIKSENDFSNKFMPNNAPLRGGNDMMPPLEREQSETLTYALIEKDGVDEYFVLVESEITPVTSTVETLRVQLIIMTVIIVIISLFIAIITAHYVSKPIHDTNKKAKQLALQNYDLTFHGGNYKELCELNDTLTYSAHELAKVDTLRRELIANISHDLRTPLTMITGYSEVMRDLPGENTPENIQIVIDEANRLSQLVSDLLDISKLESGVVAMQNQVFCLTDCIKDIFKRYTKLIEQDGYNIVFECNEDVYICADPLRISQVMYNLINNAINYCGEDKTVIVRQTTLDNTVCVEVIDHGEGIEEDKLEYIWDRYYKVDKEHRQAVVGTGLGLSIVKNILMQYDARFGVETKPNEGSDFWWTLQTAQAPEDEEFAEPY